MNPRTKVRDVILSGVPAGFDGDEVREIEHTHVVATEAACRNGHHLLDFDEYREVAL